MPHAFRPVLLALTLVALAPLADATYTDVFTRSYAFAGVYVNAQTDDGFAVSDPGGALPVACYDRSFTNGPLGSITIRIVDAHGDVVFVDEIAGAGLVGPDLPPVGLGGFAPGAWRAIVTTTGDIIGTTVRVHVAVASSASLC
jgi:hypothetical protein